MKRGVLTENAELAWRAALVYRDALWEGRDTLQNKKNFVSALHNAVELFYKQRMIFNNDHSVVTVTAKDPDGLLAKRFYNATDLNSFFEELDSEELKHIHSCDYKDLVLKDIYKQSSTDFLSSMNQGGGMKLLQKLRNEETHFVFNDSFMTDKEFEILDRFLMDFYRVLQDNELLPRYFGRRKSHIDSERNRLIPSNKKAENRFRFKKQLMQSKFAAVFKKVISENEFIIFVPDSFGIATAIYGQVDDLNSKYTFDEVFEYIVCFQKHDLIQTKMSYQMEFDGNEATYIEEPVMKIEWKE